MSLNLFSYDFKFSKTQITYSYSASDAIWNGVALYDDIQNPALPITYFTDPKQSITGQNHFTDAIKLWDAYSVFEISANNQNATGLGDVNIFVSNTLADTDSNYTDDQVNGIVGYFPQATDTTASFPSPGQTYARAEIAIDNNHAHITADGYTKWLALHEFGHVLGLLHPDEVLAQYNTDQTVMTYNIAENGSRFAVTPMAYDIAALQLQYNQGFSYDPIHDYNAAWFQSNFGFNGAKKLSMTIADTGSTVDTIDTSILLKHNLKSQSYTH
jgi:hypothetical protein